MPTPSSDIFTATPTLEPMLMPPLAVGGVDSTTGCAGSAESVFDPEASRAEEDPANIEKQTAATKSKRVRTMPPKFFWGNAYDPSSGAEGQMTEVVSRWLALTLRMTLRDTSWRFRECWFS